jgi:TldD protein
VNAVVLNDPLRAVRDGILAPAGLDVGGVEHALGLVLGSAVDWADVYFQLSREESWGLEDGIVKEGSASIRAWACAHWPGRRPGSPIPMS